VARIRTDVKEELSPSFIRVIRIGELGTTLSVTFGIFFEYKNPLRTSQETLLLLYRVQPVNAM
jgi:hypothetical protein